MKKIIFILAAVIFSLSSFAQEDVTTFLGIPVDGKKTAMIKKLKAKGFTYYKDLDILKGEFNGSKVNLVIGTYKNKVRRIGLFSDFDSNGTEIKVLFNNLVRQFSNNPKYISERENQSIPNEDIVSYEMNTNSKKYEASFYQKPNTESPQYTRRLREYLLTKYSEDEISSNDIFKVMPYSADIDKFILDSTLKKHVWFTISENSGTYKIYLMYDNEWNFSDGEDL